MLIDAVDAQVSFYIIQMSYFMRIALKAHDLHLGDSAYIVIHHTARSSWIQVGGCRTDHVRVPTC